MLDQQGAERHQRLLPAGFDGENLPIRGVRGSHVASQTKQLGQAQGWFAPVGEFGREVEQQCFRPHRITRLRFGKRQVEPGDRFDRARGHCRPQGGKRIRCAAFGQQDHAERCMMGGARRGVAI